MIIITALVLLFATACGGTSIGRAEATRIVENAVAKLDEAPHTVTITSYTTSTDSEIAAAIGENKSSIEITLDGDSYAVDEKRGTQTIKYLFVDDVLYVNESFIGIITKQSFAVNRVDGMTDAEYAAAISAANEEKAKLYDKFVGKYIEEIQLIDYEDFNRYEDADEVDTLVLGPLKDSVAARLHGELGNWTASFDSIKDSYVDCDRSTVTIKLDDEGRISSVKTIYALAIVFQDNYRALVSFVSDVTYSYDVLSLATPSDAAGYIDMESGYRGLLDQSFSVTTDVITWAEKDSDAIALLERVFGRHSIVRVDKDNYEIKFPSTSSDDALIKMNSESILFGDALFMKAEYIQEDNVSFDLIKFKVTAAGFDYYYRDAVMINFIPSFARGYVNITVSTDDDGNTTISCSGLAEDYFYELYEELNANYTGGKVLVPQESQCSYTVVIDPNGRYLKSELAVRVTVLQDASTKFVIGEEYYCVRRTFEYTEAENFYKDAAEGETWVKIPENHADYEDMYGAFN